MAEEKAVRPIAGDVGTDNRIDCDDGHYWVRLVTKAAIRREGEAMRNCLRDGDYDDGASGPESFDDISLWSLRTVAGESIALGSTIKATGHVNLGQFHGPMNNTPSPLAYRQLQHLAAAFASAGHTLSLERDRSEPIVVAPDGRTFRWDRAPKEHRRLDHEERMTARRQVHEDARRRREAAQRIRENQPPIPAGESGVIYYEPSHMGPRRRDPDGWFRTRYGLGGPTFIPWSEDPVSPFIALPPPPLPDPGYVERLAHALGIPKEQNADLVAECIQALEGDRPSSQAAQPLIRNASIAQELRAMEAAAGAGILDAWQHAVDQALLVETYEARAYRTVDGRVIMGRPQRRLRPENRLTHNELRRLWDDYASGRTP
jgi:hypothetical protein